MGVAALEVAEAYCLALAKEDPVLVFWAVCHES